MTGAVTVILGSSFDHVSVTIPSSDPQTVVRSPNRRPSQGFPMSGWLLLFDFTLSSNRHEKYITSPCWPDWPQRS